MKTNATLPIAAMFGLLCGVASAQDRAASSPVGVELQTSLTTCAVGENIVFTCRITNLTSEPIALRAQSLETIVTRMTVGLQGGAATEFNRTHPHAQGKSMGLLVLDPKQSIEQRMLLLDNDLVVPFFDQAGLWEIRATVSVPIDRDGVTGRTVAETNTILLSVEVPSKDEETAIKTLDALLEQRSNVGTELFLAQLEAFLELSAKTRLTRQAEYILVRSRVPSLDAYNKGTRKPSDVLFAAIRSCLEESPPFSAPVLTRAYLEFLGKAKRWDLVELAGHAIAQYRHRSNELQAAEAYLGAWGALINTHPFLEMDARWEARLRKPLLECLRRSLDSQKISNRVARQVLRPLSTLQEWELLEQAAECVLREDSADGSAVEYLELARSHTRVGDTQADKDGN